VGTGGPKEECIRWGAHWRSLVNTIGPSMCGGDAALCQITLTTCYTVVAIIDAPAGQVTLGASVQNGLEQKGIETITQCIKKCVSAGGGIPAVVPVCAHAPMLLWPPCGIGQAIIFLPCGYFLLLFLLLSFSIPRLISAAADRMPTIHPHMVWP